MIFGCGETWLSKKNRLEKWHPFFCLLPRTVDVVDGRRICAWLMWVERRGEYGVMLGDLFYQWRWEYRLKP